MKRYEIIPKMGRGRQLYVKAVESKDGEYVRFEDIKNQFRISGERKIYFTMREWDEEEEITGLITEMLNVILLYFTDVTIDRIVKKVKSEFKQVFFGGQGTIAVGFTGKPIENEEVD